jgi:phasin
MTEADVVTKAAKVARVAVPPTTTSPSISSEELRNDQDQDFPMAFKAFTEGDEDLARQNWQLMRQAASKLTAMTQDSCSTAIRESTDYGITVMEAARANMDAAMELARALIASKSPSEVIEVSSAHARQQLITLVQQNRRLWIAAQKATKSLIEPITGLPDSAGSNQPK